MHQLLLILSLTLSVSAMAEEAWYRAWRPYGRAAVGYKVGEFKSADSEMLETKDSAFFELGFETKSGWAFGYKHDSQISTGAPFSSPNDVEYYKDEIFISYKLGGWK